MFRRILTTLPKVKQAKVVDVFMHATSVRSASFPPELKIPVQKSEPLGSITSQTGAIFQTLAEPVSWAKNFFINEPMKVEKSRTVQEAAKEVISDVFAEIHVRFSTAEVREKSVVGRIAIGLTTDEIKERAIKFLSFPLKIAFLTVVDKNEMVTAEAYKKVKKSIIPLIVACVILLCLKEYQKNVNALREKYLKEKTRFSEKTIDLKRIDDLYAVIIAGLKNEINDLSARLQTDEEKIKEILAATVVMEKMNEAVIANSDASHFTTFFNVINEVVHAIFVTRNITAKEKAYLSECAQSDDEYTRKAATQILKELQAGSAELHQEYRATLAEKQLKYLQDSIKLEGRKATLEVTEKNLDGLKEEAEEVKVAAEKNKNNTEKLNRRDPLHRFGLLSHGNVEVQDIVGNLDKNDKYGI